MSKIESWQPRISTNVSPEIFKRWQETVPWGLRAPIIVALVEEMLDWIDAGGADVLVLILQRKLTAQNLLLQQKKGGEESGT